MGSTQLATDFTVKRLDEMEAAFGGSFVRARASLGASAFGMQVHLLPPNSGDAYPEHDHLYDGQERSTSCSRALPTCTSPAASSRWTPRRSCASGPPPADGSAPDRTARGSSRSAGSPARPTSPRRTRRSAGQRPFPAPQHQAR
jgi:hypothetical protein